MGNKNEAKITVEVKQSFLASAISDISTYIQLTDTKVSIIMAAVVAILVGIMTCYEPIGSLIASIKPCSWIGILFVILVLLGFTSMIALFVFGILTIKGHTSTIDYKSKWFWTKSTKEYTFYNFSKDIQKMDDDDIIENMAAELYKLNDINRQKAKTMKWSFWSFSTLLITFVAISVLFVINSL